MMRSGDPIDDFNCYDRETADAEKYFPHCSLCGCAITGDYYKHVHIRGLDYTLCPDCIERKYVENYVNEQL